MDADLAAAFDRIDHDHFLAQLVTFPAREMVRQWLKARRYVFPQADRLTATTLTDGLMDVATPLVRAPSGPASTVGRNALTDRVLGLRRPTIGRLLVQRSGVRVVHVNSQRSEWSKQVGTCCRKTLPNLISAAPMPIKQRRPEAGRTAAKRNSEHDQCHTGGDESNADQRNSCRMPSWAVNGQPSPNTVPARDVG